MKCLHIALNNMLTYHRTILSNNTLIFSDNSNQTLRSKRSWNNTTDHICGIYKASMTRYAFALEGLLGEKITQSGRKTSI